MTTPLPQPRVLIAEVAAVLRAEGATEVYVFGSVAERREQSTSDLDLAVRGLPPRKFFAAMARAARAAGRPIDLVDLDERSEFTDYIHARGMLRRVA